MTSGSCSSGQSERTRSCVGPVRCPFSLGRRSCCRYVPWGPPEVVIGGMHLGTSKGDGAAHSGLDAVCQLLYRRTSLRK